MDFAPDVEIKRLSREVSEFFDKVLYDEKPMYVSPENELEARG